MRPLSRSRALRGTTPLLVVFPHHARSGSQTRVPWSWLATNTTQRCHYTTTGPLLKKVHRPLRVAPVPLGTPLDTGRTPSSRSGNGAASHNNSDASAFSMDPVINNPQEPVTGQTPTPAQPESTPNPEAESAAQPQSSTSTAEARANQPHEQPDVSESLAAQPTASSVGDMNDDSATRKATQPLSDEAGTTEATENVAAAEASSASTAAPDAAAAANGPPKGEQSFMKRMFASWQQGVVASIGAAMGVGFLIYVLYAPVKEDTVHHTAMVASEALADIRIKKQAVSLSKEIVSNVLQDPQSVRLVSQLVVALLGQEETKVAISSLLQSLFEDHYTQEVTKKFVLMIVRDPWIEDQVQSIVKEQVQRLLEDDEIKHALSQFLLESASDTLVRPDLHYTTARAARATIGRFFNPWWTA